jgi:CDP-diacylglycerol--serine O-phosphatidyltransferase
MKRIRAVAVLPTLFTLGNLVCGFFAIVVLSRIDKPGIAEFVPAPQLHSVRQIIVSDDPTHNLMLCGVLILLAMFFDAVDGQVARITHAMSDFGGQLDSLSDVVSFGVAPAMLLVKMCPQFTSVHSEAIWSIAALFASCAALRLARFNVELDSEYDHTAFAGLPTPAAAAAIASFAILSYTLRNEIKYDTYQGFDWWMQRVLPMFAIVVAVLMVSRIPYPHPLTQLVKGSHSFAHVVAIVFALMAMLIVRSFAIWVICVLFVIVPPLRFLWDVVRHRRVEEEIF